MTTSHATEQPTHLDEHRELTAHIAAVLDAGQDVPCITATTSHQWTSDVLSDQRDAAQACTGCPAFTACLAYVTEQAERCGVYAGTTPAQRNGKQT